MKHARVYASALLGVAGTFAPGLLSATPPVDAAPSQLLFEWTGRVDKEIRVVMRGGRAYVDRVGNKETTSGRVYTANTLPRENARVYVERLAGRGQVDVVQQPTSANGYTTIVRVRDPQSGAANYRIRAYTTAYDDYGYGRNDRDRNRDRDDRWDDRDGPGRNGRGHAYGHYKHKHHKKDRDDRYEDRDDHRRDRRDQDRDRDRDDRDDSRRSQSQVPRWPW